MKTNKKEQEKMLDAYFSAARGQKKLLTDDEVQSIIQDRLVMYRSTPKARISRTFKILITMSLVSIISIGLYCLLPKANHDMVQHQAQIQSPKIMTPGEPPTGDKNIKPKPKKEVKKTKIIMNDGDGKQGKTLITMPDQDINNIKFDTIMVDGKKVVTMSAFRKSTHIENGTKKGLTTMHADSADYEIPDLAYDFMHINSDEKSVKPEGQRMMPDYSGIKMNSVKTIQLNKKQLASMGVYTSKSGTFVDQGNGLILAFNHKGFYLKPMMGTAVKSFPMMITDESGKDYPITMEINIQVIEKTQSDINIDSIVANRTLVFNMNKQLAEINTLVPIVVNNTSDTTEGKINNKIILWYKAGDALLQNLPQQYANQIRKESEKVECKMTTKCVDTIKSITPTFFEAAKNNTLTMNDLLVYPNPATQKVNVSFNITEDKDLTICLFSITGQLVKTLQASKHYNKGMNSMQFDINEPTGLYLINIQSAKNETWTQRLMITKN